MYAHTGQPVEFDPPRKIQPYGASVSVYLHPMVERGRDRAQKMAWWCAAWLASCVAIGCAGKVESSVQTKPPPPAPVAASTATPANSTQAPTDADGDGVLAGDQCPDEPETKNDFEDEDGCPDVVPPFRISNNRLHFEGELKFGLLGGVLNSSQPVIDGIAKLLSQHADVELVEVGVHTPAGSDATDKANKRAKGVVSALRKAGVDDKRLRAVGYGAKCPAGGERVELKVLRRGGADTGVTLCK